MSLMTRALVALLALIALGVGAADAQLVPPLPTWQNDAQGRPAPPCFFYDPTTNKTQPCTSANPLPTSAGGAGAGTGTTNLTSTTGFGKGWYPVVNASIAGTASNRLMSVYQPGGLTVNTFRRIVACGNCLAVGTSTDGGVTFSEFQTSFVAGNEVQILIKVPSTTPRYLGYVANGAASHIFSSTGLLSGWADGTTASAFLNNGIISFASNANGSTVLSSAGTGGGSPTEICRSTTQGQTFPSCVNVYAAVPAGDVWYAGGTNWLVFNTNGQVARSTNDGVSWTNITTLAGGAGGGFHGVCLASTSYQTCLAMSNGIVYRSADNGLTWLSVLPTGTVAGGLCDYGSGSVGVWGNSPPVGLGTVANNVWSTQDGGLTFFNGNVYGSTWNGAGTEGLASFSCNATGRGFASLTGTGGTFLFYNPLTQPGGVLQSSAGGYNVSALIQGGIILNATQTSAATTAQTITLTGASGSRVCIRKIVVFSSNATQNVTLVVQDATVTTLNFGTVSTTATAGNPLSFDGQPLFCGQTGDSVQVVVGAAAAGTTTLSVVADRYPN